MTSSALGKTLSQRWAKLPPNTRGALWILVAALGFSGMTVCLKLLSKTMPVWEMVVLRAMFSILIISPALIRTGPTVLRTRRLKTHLFRSLLGMGGLVGMYIALAHLDLALVTTLGFTRTLFVILLAVLFLGEVVRWRRTAATIVGFLGVIVCVQPGDSFDPWTLAGLGAALFAAGVMTLVKRLTTTESPLTILLWTYLLMGSIALIPALFVWRAPSAYELFIIALMGVFSTWGQTCMVHGLRVGETTAVAPFEYTRLLYAALLGFLIFGEVPNSSTWYGGVLIIGSTIYIAMREHRLGKARAQNPSKPDNLPSS